MNSVETIILVVIILIALFVMLPSLFAYDDTKYSPKLNERFTNEQKMYHDGLIGSPPDVSPANYPNANENSYLGPQNDSKNYESLIYDNVTGTIMSGSQFMESTGFIAPPWVAPAWDPNAYGPSSKGTLNPADYENDPRLLYNKCSLSCCSPQYPTPFQIDPDPFVCDENGNSKYLASNLVCTNNAGGSGCLCMTPIQAKGFENGFVDYSVDKQNLGY